MFVLWFFCFVQCSLTFPTVLTSDLAEPLCLYCESHHQSGVCVIVTGVMSSATAKLLRWMGVGPFCLKVPRRNAGVRGQPHSVRTEGSVTIKYCNITCAFYAKHAQSHTFVMKR